MTTTILTLDDCALLLRPTDDVAVTTRDLKSGTPLEHDSRTLVVGQSVPRGHERAVRAVPQGAQGAQVHKYGQSIGPATRDVAVGDHVHSHDLGMDGTARTYQRYAAHGGGSLDNNPSPGNEAGGLTTILEKSLGQVAKGGTAELSAVYEYGERVTAKGFTFMDTPGYDPVHVTGIVAGRIVGGTPTIAARHRHLTR